MKTPTKYKIINGTDTSLEFIYSDQIISMKEVEDKYRNKHLMVNWYDDEYCINCTLFCDRLEKIEE